MAEKATELTPFEHAEQVYELLVQHYSDGEDADIRAAAKMLLVVLDRMKQHGGPGWTQLFEEYLNIARYDHEKFDRMIQAQRSVKDPGAQYEM